LGIISGTNTIKYNGMGIGDKILHLLAAKIIVKSNVSDAVAKERMSVCFKCENRDPENEKCKVCGCFLDLKTTTDINWNVKRNRQEVTHCPLGKWNDLETANEYRKIDGFEPLSL
jgi:hypothetical protein